MEFIRRESKELVEKTLPGIAPTLFRAFNVATVDYENAPSIVKNEMGLKEHQMPIIYIDQMLTNHPILYTGKLKENAIRVWA